MTRQQSRFTATLLGALAGFALAVGEVDSTLAYLQAVPRGFHGLPRPANLDWIETWAGTASALTAASGLLALLTHGLLLGMALIIFRTLNPEFRLTEPLPPEAESGAVLRQPIDRRRLRQVGGASLVSLWLLGYLGVWLPWWHGKLLGLLLAGPAALEHLWPRDTARANVTGSMLLLGGLWLTWGEAGLLRPAAGQQRRVGMVRAIAAAALAGIALTPFALPLAGWAQEIATEVLQGIGGAAPGAWLCYLSGVLVVYPVALGAAGWTAMSLARWSQFPWERRALALGATVAAGAWLGVVILLSLAGAGRFDHGVPLARAAGVPVGPGGMVTTLTLLPGPRPVLGLTPTVSGQGLTATDASARQVWAYLQWRRFRTVHLFPALMHVCQCEALDWDSDRFLDTVLRSLEQNPHPGFCQLLVEKLAHCAATPKARAALAQLQDPRRFHLPAGGEGVLEILRRRLEPAGVEVRGRVFVNGSPARGMRVGLVDEPLWEQLRGTPLALSHRLVVTSSPVNEAGGFRLGQIPAGRYFLVLLAPARGAFRLSPSIVVQGSPGPITVAPDARGVDVGSVRLFLAAPPPRDEDRPARGVTLPNGYFAFFVAPPAAIFDMSHLSQQ